MNFYISDTHFGHKNVLRFDQRPFEGCHEMRMAVTELWNETVTNEDTVYILGDYIWSNSEKEWEVTTKALNGKKVLIRGNHDVMKNQELLKELFLDVKDYMEVDDEGRRVIICHYPIPFYRASWNPNIYMLYGHVHTTREAKIMRDLTYALRESAKQSETYSRGQAYGVGCMLPYMNYTPRTLDEIIAGDALLQKAESN